MTADEVHLWYAFTDKALPGDLERYKRLLSPEEAARHDRLMRQDDRMRFLVSHALARTALSSCCEVAPEGWRFETGDYGKPEISAPPGLPPIRFNISHTSGLCACALTLGHDVGVDVEWTGRRTAHMEIAGRFFSEEEAEALKAAAPSQRRGLFFDYWTLKEAYIKACGRGLSMPLRAFSFRLRKGRPPGISFSSALNDDPARWKFFRLTPGPDYRAAVAVRAAGEAELSLVVREAVSF
jgi:4'-phosphopantetheinyl transferase